jgi:hypothetical protein
VVQRGLDKKAPFHRRNSVADALLIDICLGHRQR